MSFVALTSQPVMRIEAPGHVPLETGVMSESATNLVLRLKAGSGPNGVVLLPDGTPAQSATLVYGGHFWPYSLGYNGFTSTLSFQPEFSSKDGKFAFKPRPENSVVMAAHTAGWAQATVPAGGGEGLELRLKPWAAVKGRLVDSNGAPAKGIELHLMMYPDPNYGGTKVNLDRSTVTDARGYFFFSTAPPMTRLDVQRTVPGTLTNAGMTYPIRKYQLQSWLVARPGVTNDLGTVTLDTPPPLPVVEQIKKKLGL